MIHQFQTSITYFLQEGRENLPHCLRISFEAAVNHRINQIIIFTAEGVGIVDAIKLRSEDERFRDIKVIAVTFPSGYPFTENRKPKIVEINRERRKLFQTNAVPIVRAHLPFNPIQSNFSERGRLGQDLSLVGDALNMFGGSMSLCVQAIVLSCDAGEVEIGDHVIAMTSDTSILARACPTREMLSGLRIREILCKPAIYNIGKGESLGRVAPEPDSGSQTAVLEGEQSKQLPSKQ